MSVQRRSIPLIERIWYLLKPSLSFCYGKKVSMHHLFP
jgi:hypothetical protein